MISNVRLPDLPETSPSGEDNSPDWLTVQVWPDATIVVEGRRERIEEFLRLCSEHGIDIQMRFLSPCG